ncbi:MAG: PAS domain S-box protein [Chitinophagales bacterium]
MVSENSYKQLLAALSSITWSLTPNGEMLTEQKGWSEFTGQTKAEYKGLGWMAAVHPDDLDKIKQSISDSNEIKSPVFEDHLRIFNRKDGRYHLLLVKGIPIFNKENTLEKWFGACIDIQELKDKEQLARFNEARYRRLSDVTEEGVCVSKDMRIVEVNRAFGTLFGYAKEELYGKNVLNLAFDEATTRLVYKHLNQGIEKPYEGVGIRKDGTKFYAHISGKNIEDEGQKFRVSIIRDITKEKVYHQKIIESEQRFRQLIEQAPFAIEIYNTEGYLEEANKEFESVWKLKPSDLIGTYNILESRHFYELGILPYIERAFKGEIIETPEFEYDPREDGLDSDVRRWFKARMYPIFKSDKNIKNIVIMYEDISDQKESEKEILSSFIRGEDKERHRIAKEIHDGLAQYLTAANLNLNSIKADTHLESKKMARFELGLKFLQQAIDESRSIAQNLMPKAIEDFGLILSIESLINNISKSLPIELNFYHNSKKISLDAQGEMNLYRITQEAINNALKYAKPTKIIVQLICHKDELIFTVEDNGKGFLTDKLKYDQNGLGLRSIANRVKSMSGKLEIDSSPGKGTLITIAIPLIDKNKNYEYTFG